MELIELATIASDRGEIKILRSPSTGSVLYNQSDYCQSEADNNGVSLAGYIHAIYGLLIQAKAREVLMIGCGGGTLATMLSQAGVAVTMVDIDPCSFRIAREYFALPEAVDCYVGDGLDFLAKAGQRYDAVVLDAYDGSHIPPHLVGDQFFATVAARLVPDGCLVANVHVRDDRDYEADRVAHRMGAMWPAVRLLEAPRMINRNAIVMAGGVATLEPPALLRPVESRIETANIRRDLAQLRFRKLRPVPAES